MDRTSTHRIPDCNSSEFLGEPLDITKIALLLGCSVWTVRQKYVPLGLPHLRTGPAGKFVFFRGQVIDWILNRQKKGGSE